MTINWRFILSKWWKATLMGLLIAVGIALFPQAQCAVAQTCVSRRDYWCNNGLPGKCCDPAAGFSAVTNCAGKDPNSDGKIDYCQESGPGFTEPEVPVRCQNLLNCEVTQVLGSPNRLSGGYWTVGKCEVDTVRNTCIIKSGENSVRATCCTGSSGSGGGCTPSYAPPTIDDTYTVDPPNPIVWTQEQPPYGMALGMTVNDIKAHGGQDTACGTGQANITSITVNLTLTQQSIDWILGELSQRYINVRIKDTYPKYPEIADATHAYAVCSSTPGVTGYNTPNAELDCRFFRPLDPGSYAVNVTACQSDGKCTTKTLPEPIRVWLLESRLLAPEP